MSLTISCKLVEAFAMICAVLIVHLKDALKTNVLTDSTDRIIFRAKLGRQSEIDAENVCMKV